MKSTILYILFYCLCVCAHIQAQIPQKALIGYWHNWNMSEAPYIQLNALDSRYNVIDFAFAVPHAGTDYQMEFIPEIISQATCKNYIVALQNQGKKIIISIGGATAPISLDNINERNTFITTMNAIIDQYGFDGIDIDLVAQVGANVVTNPFMVTEVYVFENNEWKMIQLTFSQLMREVKLKP